MASLSSIFKGRTVLVTGHTGFKGSWLSIWLKEIGAHVVGYALKPHTSRDNFAVSKLDTQIESIIGDIRDYTSLKQIFDKYHPEIVFHLAAQPIVRLSYKQPRETYATNLIGTVNLLECCRLTDSVKVVVNVTSDKCYQNNEWDWGYRETDTLGGHDPYSSSKACSEIITAAYRDSFFNGKYVSTVRAGNVIGGGDWQLDRLVPDCIRSLLQESPIILRNPESTRPWQHVLEPLSGYLLLASRMWVDGETYSGAWNFSPYQQSAIPVKELVTWVIYHWGKGKYTCSNIAHPHEDKMLALDSSKARRLLGWKSRLNIDKTVKYTVDWYKNPNPDYDLCRKQIHDYCEEK
jgi:CDP-glucose 4,6-dehydratase